MRSSGARGSTRHSCSSMRGSCAGGSLQRLGRCGVRGSSPPPPQNVSRAALNVHGLARGATITRPRSSHGWRAQARARCSVAGSGLLKFSPGMGRPRLRTRRRRQQRSRLRRADGRWYDTGTSKRTRPASRASGRPVGDSLPGRLRAHGRPQVPRGVVAVAVRRLTQAAVTHATGRAMGHHRMRAQWRRAASGLGVQQARATAGWRRPGTATVPGAVASVPITVGAALGAAAR